MVALDLYGKSLADSYHASLWIDMDSLRPEVAQQATA
jgi:hypothetical protein